MDKTHFIFNWAPLCDAMPSGKISEQKLCGYKTTDGVEHYPKELANVESHTTFQIEEQTIDWYMAGDVYSVFIELGHASGEKVAQWFVLADLVDIRHKTIDGSRYYAPTNLWAEHGQTFGDLESVAIQYWNDMLSQHQKGLATATKFHVTEQHMAMVSHMRTSMDNMHGLFIYAGNDNGALSHQDFCNFLDGFNWQTLTPVQIFQIRKLQMDMLVVFQILIDTFDLFVDVYEKYDGCWRLDGIELPY